MLRIDKSGDTAALLDFRHHMQGNSRLSAGLRSVDLNNSSLGNAAKAKRDIK